MDDRTAEILDRYSLKERLQGFTLKEVLSLFDPKEVFDLVVDREPAIKDSSPPPGTGPSLCEIGKLCTALGEQIRDLQQNVAALTDQLKTDEAILLALQKENRALHEKLAPDSDGESSLESGITGETPGEANLIANESISPDLRPPRSLFFKPLRRLRAALRARNLARLLSGESDT